MQTYMKVMKRIVRRTIIFFRRPVVYLFISYLFLFATFVLSIKDTYQNNIANGNASGSYFDYVVNTQPDDGILMQPSSNVVR